MMRPTERYSNQPVDSHLCASSQNVKMIIEFPRNVATILEKLSCCRYITNSSCTKIIGPIWEVDFL